MQHIQKKNSPSFTMHFTNANAPGIESQSWDFAQQMIQLGTVCPSVRFFFLSLETKVCFLFCDLFVTTDRSMGPSLYASSPRNFHSDRFHAQSHIQCKQSKQKKTKRKNQTCKEDLEIKSKYSKKDDSDEGPDKDMTEKPKYIPEID